MMVLHRIFSTNFSDIEHLFAEAAPRRSDIYIQRYTDNIDVRIDPKTLLFGLVNGNSEFVGWLHLDLSFDWEDLEPFHRLNVGLAINQIYIAKEHRMQNLGTTLASMSGTLAGSLVNLARLYKESPESKPGLYSETADPLRELTTSYQADIIHPGALKAVSELRYSFDRSLQSRCAPLSRFLWHPNEPDSNTINIDVLADGFFSIEPDDWEFLLSQYQ